MSKEKLKKGGMAFIVKCPPQPLNIGRAVELLEPYVDHWYCGGNIEPSDGGTPRAGEVSYSRTLIPAKWLRPIDGNTDDEADESRAWLPPVPRTVTPSAPCRNPVPIKEHS